MRRLLIVLGLWLTSCAVTPVAPVVIPLPGTSPPATSSVTTTTLPMPELPNRVQGERATPAFLKHPIESISVGNGEDCTVYCATRFGPGIGVTCHAWLDPAGQCHPFCYYQNGWWFDESTGRAIRTPQGSSPEQRPTLGQVAPYGYCTEHNCSMDTWLECPERYEGVNVTPKTVQEACVAMARSEYHEGYNFCR